MNYLFSCEFYYPSVGGVQKVIQEIAERLVKNGHKVTIATSALPNRKELQHNGVQIAEFNVIGNSVNGMTGDVEKYQEFLVSGNFDSVMIKAAQQWTFDAMIPVLDDINYRKIHIPCGYPGLFNPVYSDYYQAMPTVLNKFDHLIFYSADYRDIKFALEHGYSNNTVIPNGASKKEFSIVPDDTIRTQLGIDEENFVLLTVGSFTGAKGHLEIVHGYELLDVNSPTTLILNGNQPPHPALPSFFKQIKMHLEHGILSTGKWLAITMLRFIGIIKKQRSIDTIIEEIHRNQSNKKVLVTDLPRHKLIQIFFSSNLFVFASHSEYSPLVLFEAAAAGLPFLSVPVGNAQEIAKWTECGKICSADRDEFQIIKPDPAVLAVEIKKLIEDPEEMKKMSLQGKKLWKENFYWDKIVLQYEKVLSPE